MQEIDRTRRVGELIKREVATLIASELNDNRVNMATVTRVTVSRDLKQSTVFFLMMNNQLDHPALEILLNKCSGRLRKLLSKRLQMRTTPALHFKYDSNMEKGISMSQLISSLSQGHGE